MADNQIYIRIHGLAVTGASRSGAQPDPSGFQLPSQPREGHGAHGQGSPRDPLMPSGEAVRPPSNMVPAEGGGAKEDAWERRARRAELHALWSHSFPQSDSQVQLHARLAGRRGCPVCPEEAV